MVKFLLSMTLGLSFGLLSCNKRGQEDSAVVQVKLPTENLPEKVRFNQHIRPILNKNCTTCHGGVFAGNDAKMPGGVSFIYRHLALGKGSSGKPTITPGHPDKSELFARILSNDEDDIMPPPDHGPRLQDHEIAMIKKWIEQGAEWEVHWAFEPPTLPKIPPPKEASSKHPIDLLAYEKMELLGLSPAPQASPATLLRRLSFDLIGLPPTIEELDQFLSDFESNPSSAYQAAIHKLLNSNSYGERWASVWLDLARYADSEGLGADRRRQIWPYRDWVIKAYNDDLPYDDFTIKQLAGDYLENPSLEDLIATGFHRNTQTNHEGGTDDEEFRIAAVMDRVNTTWEVWQGQTFGCVQCHSHPYDTFEMKEYYDFLAFFNNDKDGDESSHYPTIKVPFESAHYKEAEISLKELNKRESEFINLGHSISKKANWKSPLNSSVHYNKTKAKIVKTELGEEIHSDGIRVARSTFTQTWKPKSDRLTAIKIHIIPKKETITKSLPINGSTLSFAQLILNLSSGKTKTVPFKWLIPDSMEATLPPQQTLNKKSVGGWGPRTKQFHPRWAVMVPEGSIDLTEVESISVQMEFNYFYLASFVFVPERILLQSSDTEFYSLPSQKLDEKYELYSQANTHYQNIQGIRMPIMQARDPKLARNTHKFERGNWLEKGLLIEKPNTPKSFPPLNSNSPNRLAMARWLISEKNPLSARVEANRIWQQLFGTGIVETLEDFGSSGSPPSNQKLLDHLAHTFQHQFQFSRKKLIKYIVSSAIYQQSPIASKEQRQKDPTNTFLSYGSRRRLRAESIRDMGLANSKLLTKKLYGQPTFPPIPPGVWKPFQGGDKWTTPEIGKPERYRKAIYTYLKRSIPYPALSAFDVPTREVSSKRRLISNTPTAALTTLNDAAFLEFAQGLAQRMKYEKKGSLEEKISYGFRISTSKFPSQAILTTLMQAYHTAKQNYLKYPNQLKGIAKTPDGGAFTILASLILNLDASMTK